jgi:hypothetical protein
VKRIDLDTAYWEAADRAGAKGTSSIAVNYIEWVSFEFPSEYPIVGDPRVLNSAYQHFLAARKAGIDEVGVEVFGQALIDLGWSTADDLDLSVAYFRGSQQSVQKVAQEIARGDWGMIYRGACEAARLSVMWGRGGIYGHYDERAVPVWVMEKDLKGSQLEWLLRIPAGFGDATNIHQAMMADQDFADSVHEFLALPERT